MRFQCPDAPMDPPLSARSYEREPLQQLKSATMAASTTAARAVAFRFHLAASPPHPNHHLSLRPLPPKPNKPFSLSSYTHPSKPTTISPPKSIDVSKEDKPTSSASDQNPAPPPPLNFAESDPEQNLEFDSSQGIDKRRLEEKFAVLNTGIYECRSCGFKYDQSVGDPSYPIPPGLPFSQLPEDWRCGTCGAAKNFFDSKSVEIAGFAQNQQFGLGGNTLTSGQKALLIYGSLLFFFVLFLSGYFLQ